VTLVPFVKCRYQNQEHSVEVQFPGAAVNETTVSTLFEKFHDVYQREYTYRLDAPSRSSASTLSPRPRSAASSADAGDRGDEAGGEG
jgi:hypothetical protein